MSPPPGAADYSAVAEWDRDMHPEKVRKLSPDDKRARTNLSLKRKVDEVAAAASTRPGTGLQGLPGSLTALRERNLPSRGMYRLRDREAERRLENAQEILRWKAAVTILKGPEPQGSITREEGVDWKAQCDALREQLVRMVKELATRAPSLDEIRR